MRSSTVRRAPAVPSALLLGALLTACAGTSPTAAPATGAAAPTAVPTVATTSPRPTIATSPVPATQEVTELSLVLADGAVTGDTPLARLTVGRPVRLTVTSDVADELHLHGVDQTLRIEPGASAVLAFTPASPGRFEVELHEARRVLTRLQVR